MVNAMAYQLLCLICVVYYLINYYFMFRKQLLSLSSVTRDQYKTFRFQDQSSCKIDYADIRQQITEFFLFLRNGLRR